MVAIDQFFKELCHFKGFYSFQHFFSLLTDIHLIFVALLCHTKIQMKFEFGLNPMILAEVFRTFF
jgi:hypothetical protein